jgi:hypothetical protein
MVKTRRGDNSLLDESLSGVNENNDDASNVGSFTFSFYLGIIKFSSQEDEKEVMPKRRSLRSRDPGKYIFYL